MRYYHGVNAATAEEAENIGWEIKAFNAINGYGIYLARDIEVAKQYSKGGFVIEFTMSEGFEVDIVRPIDQRYTEDMSLYSECESNGLEFVVQNEARFHSNLEDVAVHKVA